MTTSLTMTTTTTNNDHDPYLDAISTANRAVHAAFLLFADIELKSPAQRAAWISLSGASIAVTAALRAYTDDEVGA